MFDKDDAGKKFLLNMSTALLKEKLLVQLSVSKYDLTVKIIKNIISSTLQKQFAKEYKAEKILELIVRLYKKEKGDQQLMRKDFVGSVFWKDIDLWVKIFGLIHDREEKLAKLEKAKSAKSKGIKGFFNSIITKATNSHALQIKKRIEEVVLYKSAFYIVCFTIIINFWTVYIILCNYCLV